MIMHNQLYFPENFTMKCHTILNFLKSVFLKNFPAYLPRAYALLSNHPVARSVDLQRIELQIILHQLLIRIHDVNEIFYRADYLFRRKFFLLIVLLSFL